LASCDTAHFWPTSYTEQDNTGSLGYFANRGSAADRQQFGEADFVPVRISDMKETLALRSIHVTDGEAHCAAVLDHANSSPGFVFQ
jgi:hypothetical protein